MKLVEFTTTEKLDDKSAISNVRFLLADHDDPDARQEWIEARVSIDAQTVLNGALLRSKALSQVRDILDQLAKDYEHLGRSILK